MNSLSRLPVARSRAAAMRFASRSRWLPVALVLALAAVATELPQAKAGPIALTDIAWGTATTIAGDSDVDTTGSLVYAYNFGETGAVAAVTINGVAFQPFGVTTSANSNIAFNSDMNLYENNGVLAADLNTGSGASPFSTLTTNYRSLLASQVYASYLTDIQVVLDGLTPGSKYRLQWWSNDSAPTSFASQAYFDSVIASGSATSVTLDTNTTGLAGGLGQYAIGTFTATDSKASFLLTGTGGSGFMLPLMNALQVRIESSPVPEIDPAMGGSALSLVAGVLAMIEQRRRRATLVA